MTEDQAGQATATGQPYEPVPRRWYLRAFSVANTVSAIAATGAFVLGRATMDTNLGVVATCFAAGLTAGVVWWVISRFNAGPSLASALDGLPLLGVAPVDKTGPAPALVSSYATDRYTGLLREIEGHTTGRLLLISSPGPGQGASSVALNLAIAATKAGRRVMLVDADATPRGLGRFLSTGRTPGLSDLADGSSSLADATRMLDLGDGMRFPLLPSGDAPDEPHGFGGSEVSEALDSVADRADFVLIDAPPALWSDVTDGLAKHADGTILVISDTADAGSVSETRQHLEEAGAPALGYVRNRSTGAHSLVPVWWRRALAHAAIATAVFLGGFVIYTGANIWSSWNSVEKDPYDISQLEIPMPPGAAALAQESEAVEVIELTDDEPPPADTPSTTAPPEAYETFLLIGSDAIAGQADVILYLVKPTNSADAFMVSLPRDLYVNNPCTDTNARINALIHGCDHLGTNGPSLLAFAVSDFTGIQVDHFARFNFSGFRTIIDAVGGVEICVDNPVYDKQASLSLPAGCTNANGEQALSWVRSRHTLEKVNGSWKSLPGAGDLLRNQHQQDIILELFKELKSFDSPGELMDTVSGLASSFTLDNTLSLPDAVSLAWSMRGIDLEDINRIALPVRMTRSKSGQSILVSTQPFDEVLIDVYGGSLPTEDETATQSATPGE